MSTAYHPRSNGQTERVNQCLETFLRCFVHACPKQWRQWLDQAEFWYNTTWHSALGRSPFEVLYGYPPRQFGIAVSSDTAITDLESWLSDRALMTKVIRQHLTYRTSGWPREGMNRPIKTNTQTFIKFTQPHCHSGGRHCRTRTATLPHLQTTSWHNSKTVNGNLNQINY